MTSEQHPPSAPGTGAPTGPLPGAEKFGAAPVWGIATTAIVGVGGFGLFLWQSTAEVVARCGSEVMGPGDVCETTRNGIRTGIRSYPEVLAQAERMKTVGTFLGLALMVIAIVFLVLLAVRWRQDVAARARFVDESMTPVSSHSSTAHTSLLGIVFGGAGIGFGGLLVLQGLPETAMGYLIGGGAIVLGGLALLIAVAVPKNGRLLQVFDQGLRVIRGGELSDVPWANLRYQIVPQKGTASHYLVGKEIGGRFELAGITGHEQLQREAQQRTLRARMPAMIETYNRGETVDFAKVQVSKQGVVVGREQIAWPEYAGVGLHQGQVTVHRHGGKPVMIGLGLVRDYAALAHLLDMAQRAQQPAPPQPYGTPPQQG
jgi:hypothetical protein